MQELKEGSTVRAYDVRRLKQPYGDYVVTSVLQGVSGGEKATFVTLRDVQGIFLFDDSFAVIR